MANRIFQFRLVSVIRINVLDLVANSLVIKVKTITVSLICKLEPLEKLLLNKLEPLE